MMGDGAHKVICIAPQFFSRLITVLFHPRKEPCYRLHKGVIVHDRIPLIALKPVAGISVMLGKNNRLWIGILDRLAEFLPELMVVLIASPQIRGYIQPPSIHIIRRGYPFPSNI